MSRPICFMVMPFGTKPVEPKVDGAPDKIDFDALWTKAFSPVIEELGYEPVRADQDTGAAIILEMLERLFFSDIVVADMTVPNGNVYYEIGIRHASRPRGCVLISAAWTRPLFDVNQLRRLTYPLPEGAISDETAATIREVLKKGARELAEGTSPMFQHLPGFPDPTKIDPERASAIRSQLDALAGFQARVREARLADPPARQRELAMSLCDEFPASKPMSQMVALELVMLLRDSVGWEETIAYVDALPQSIRDLDVVQEQRSLAKSKAGDHELAIGALEELVRRRGDSSERQGLIGGRYKKLASQARAAGNPRAYRRYLDSAIEHYARGMRLDLNDFYPTSNLPRLYKERGDTGDLEKAAVAAQVAMLACDRDERNEWRNPTRLGLAFDAADVDKAKEYARAVQREGAAAWKLETTLADLERSVAQVGDATRQQALQAILDDLKALVP
jgi:tetratricopeptide (TPR) repeat protein